MKANIGNYYRRYMHYTKSGKKQQFFLNGVKLLVKLQERIMPTVIAESKRHVMGRMLCEGGYDWSVGANINYTPDEKDAAENEQRMIQRYRFWAQSNIVTYTSSQFESAFRHYRDTQFETINPIDDTITLPEPRYDEQLKKIVVPKNVFDKNVLSRRRFLFEIDGMSLEDQRIILEPLLQRNIIQRVVFSGNKSMHCIIEERDEPEASPDDESYKFAWRFMARRYFKDMRFDLSLPMKINKDWHEVVDNRCGHPSRTTRSPFFMRKDEKTNWQKVEQKLLYFENNHANSGWREAYLHAKARETEERERMRKRAQQAAFRNRDQEKKIPNFAARRFIGGDMSDGWKHANMGSAVASLKACGYSREEVVAIFAPYDKELRTFAIHSFDYFERKDGR